MSLKTMLVSSGVGFGALGLLWAAWAVRGVPAPAPAKSAAKKTAARRPLDVEPPLESTRDMPSADRTAPAASGGGEYTVIEERLLKMEEKLLTLETKRSSLAGANQELERQIIAKNTALSARTMAEWRVRNWEQLLGLSETQKQTLIDLCTEWGREDAGRPASRDTWLSRESDLRSRLSVEQAAKLHNTAVTQSQQMWNYLGGAIGGMIGASKEDSLRFQQVLGDYRAPNVMLLPEGHGADWPGMMREGSSRLQPVLSSDQMAKLSRFIQK